MLWYPAQSGCLQWRREATVLQDLCQGCRLCLPGFCASWAEGKRLPVV